MIKVGNIYHAFLYKLTCVMTLSAQRLSKMGTLPAPMPSRVGCRSQSRGRALHKDASWAAPSRGRDLELEGRVNVSL